jgi:PAS domain S-box-containing protein
MRDTEAVLQDVFNTISIGIFVVDVMLFEDREPEATDFRFVTINPAYAQMLSLPTTAIAGLCPHQCLPLNLADRLCDNFSRCIKQRQSMSYKECFEIEAHRCTVLTKLSPKFEPDGRISRIIGLSQDITEIRRVEAVLQTFGAQMETTMETQIARLEQTNKRSPVESSDREKLEDFLSLTQLFLDRTEVMTCLVGKDGRFLYVNEAACQLLNYSREELLTMRVADVTPDFSAEIWPEHWQEVKQHRSFTFESVKKAKGNRQFPVEITVNYFEFNGGEYNFVFVRDITNRKQAEEALSQEKELLSTLIKNAPIGIISTDELGKILFVNPAFERICGYSSQELVGQTPPYPYWDLADLDKINQEFTLAMSGKKEQIELWFTRKNGERFLARLQPITIFDDQGNMLRHLATMEDITKYKQAEEELHKALETERELNELKSRFIATISHEYRTPLTTILSSAELLERYAHEFTQENRLKHYRRIQTTANILTQLVNDILTISKIESAKQEFNPAWLDLEKYCSELVEELQLTIGSQHNLVFTSYGCDSLATQELTSMSSAYMDEKLLRYIIGNLLSNAIKYSPKGSTVRFDLACHQDKAIVRIQDEGIGITPEDQQHLFESFHRGSNVGTISGTGLGLAIVKRAVDLHGGQIAVASEIGVGTTFTATLPLNSHVKTNQRL